MDLHDGTAGMLAETPEFHLVLATTSSQELLGYLEDNKPEVILMDIQMSEINGIDLCKLILNQYRDIKIIAFSSFGDTRLVRQVMRNGAPGHVLKNAGLPTQVKTIQTVMTCQEYKDEVIARILVQESIAGQRRSMFEIPLTKREKEILQLVAEEHSIRKLPTGSSSACAL